MTAHLRDDRDSGDNLPRYTVIVRLILQIVARRVPHLPAHEREEFAVNFVSDWVADCHRTIKDQAVALRFQFLEQGHVWTPSAKTACELLERIAKSLECGKLRNEDGDILLVFLLRYLQSKVGFKDVRNQAHNHWRRLLRFTKRFPSLTDLTPAEVSPEAFLNSIQKPRDSEHYFHTFEILNALVACAVDLELKEQRTALTKVEKIHLDTTRIVVNMIEQALPIHVAAKMNRISAATLRKRRQGLFTHMKRHGYFSRFDV